MNGFSIRDLILPLITLSLFFGTPVWSQNRSDWKAQWEKTLAAARKEGEVTVYGQARFPTSAAIKEFENVYPEIKLNFVGGSGSQLASKVMAEYRAQKHLVDIAIGGGATQVRVYYQGRLIIPMSSALILPEVIDESVWWEQRHRYADPEKRYVFIMRGDVSANMGVYNTNLVRPGEIKSWWDLLDAKWKGKIVITDPRSSGNIASWKFLYYSPELGPSFLKRFLAETDIRFSVDERQMMDWVGSGKYPVHLLAKGSNIDRAIEQGLPVRQLFTEKEAGDMGAGSHHISLFKNAPHPHAAKVYVNWALSREGQIAWQRITKSNSLRMDIPKDHVPSEVIPKVGKKYMMTSDPEYIDVKPLRKLVAQILGTARRQ